MITQRVHVSLLALICLEVSLLQEKAPTLSLAGMLKTSGKLDERGVTKLPPEKKKREEKRKL